MEICIGAKSKNEEQIKYCNCKINLICNISKAKGKGKRTMDNGAIECRLLQDAVCINKTAEKYKQYAKQAAAEPDAEDENPKRGLQRMSSIRNVG